MTPEALSSSSPSVAGISCPDCDTMVAPSLVSCPGCGWLVHGARLREIAIEAERAEAAGDPAGALAAWRNGLDLLPTDSRQHQVILARVQDLSANVTNGTAVSSAGVRSEPARGKSRMPAWIASLGVAGIMIWKFKFILVFAATKLKFLLLGFSKAGTFFSMLAAFGAYWTLWGWRFALGFILSIYVHEMGHVAALSKYGIKASAPMFIPGFGAFVRMKQMPANATEDARVGLAGPNWGLGAAIFCWIVSLTTGSAFWSALASVGAWINLFNLLPVFGLDGGRAFGAMSRAHRWIAVGVLAGAWFVTGDGLLILLAIVAGMRATGEGAAKSDTMAIWNYAGLVVALSFLVAMNPSTL